MRVLLDESLPIQLADELGRFTTRTVRQQGWNSLKNGELLRRASGERFDVFVTADQNLEYQQNIARADIGVVVIAARTNRIEDLIPLVPKIISAIASSKRGHVLHVQ
jgi:predicted nuclease of predicted toxin-antitoxin system